METPASILIVKPSSLGDVVHTLPALATLRKRWPHAKIRWLVNPEWAPLLQENPLLDEILLFPRNQFRGLAGLTKVLPWARSLRSTPVDLVLDFQGLLRSALISTLFRPKRILGLSDAREGASLFYHASAPVSGISHAVDRYLALAELAGADTTPPLHWPLPSGLPVPGVPQNFLLLHPFSRGAGKSLLPSEVASLCHALAPTPVVLAGRSDQQLPPIQNVLNLLNQTSLSQLLWLIRQANCVVSVDSGPMHIAAALTPRLLSIHTWSDPQKVGPYRPDAWVWKNGSLFQRGSPDLARPLPREGLPSFLTSQFFDS